MKKQMIISGCFLVAAMLLVSFTTVNNTASDDWVVPSKYKKMPNPYADDKDADNIGRILYSKHCKSCHGSKGKGDGTKAKSLDTPIRDFSSEAVKSQTDGVLYYKTVIGRDEMPSFENKISDEEERWLLVNYIKTF